MMSPRATLLIGALFCSAIVFVTGCSEREYAPVSGKVLYRGEPLKFGSVMFQPEAGQPARGQIQADGSFYLSTHGDGDGARIGRNLVRVTCSETQRPQADGTLTSEPGLGKSLIPEKYDSPEHSGLVVEVPPEGKTDVVLELKDP
jgi:hypothetical protein